MPKRIHCSECQRPPKHCYCENIVKRDNRFPIKLIQSIRESKHPFNTGRIAQLSLSNCESKIVENTNINSWLNTLLPDKPVVAFPAPEAKDISSLKLPENTPIIFIDDTWRKAKRYLYEYPLLNSLPKICLPSGLKSGYALRQTGKHSNNAEWQHSQPMCTLESIVLSLNYLEDHTNHYSPILQCLDWVINKQRKFC